MPGALRAEAADFRVEERLGFAPDGGAAHRLLFVEKQDANTLYVARKLAARAGCASADVGFAGMKDRRAIARQWFSVPASAEAALFADFSGEGFRVLAQAPHSRKLRRGALAGNRFHIRIRELEGDIGKVAERVARVAYSGVPNYFGAQRFGKDGANIERVADWIATGRLPRGREPRAFVMSATRAIAFNAVLGARVSAGSWNRLLPGEIVNLTGSQSVFAAEGLDESLLGRCAGGDIGPTGPLCGTTTMAPRGEAGLVEDAALAMVSPLPGKLARSACVASGVRSCCAPRILPIGSRAATSRSLSNCRAGHLRRVYFARSSTPRFRSSIRTESGVEQHVERAGAAVVAARGAERAHHGVTPKPAIDGGLEHGAPVSGSTALAVDDPQAMPFLLYGLREKCGERMARLVLRQAVQVEFVAHRVVAAAQTAQGGLWNARPSPGEFVAGFYVEFAGIERQRFRKYARLVRAAGGRTRPAAHAFGDRFRLPKRCHAAHCGTEQVAFLVLDDGNLRQCARATGLTV